MKTPFKRLLLLVFSVVFSMGIIEVLTLAGVDFRVVFHTPVEVPWNDPRNLNEPELLHIHRPHQILKGLQYNGDLARFWCLPQSQNYTYDIRYDHRGFRNETDMTSAEIAVIGDSIVEGSNVRSEDLMTSVLQRDLNGPRVVNLGQAWYGPQQHAIVLRRYALPLHPQVIVWVFFEGNDLADYLRYDRAKANWAPLAASFHSFRDRSFIGNVFRLAKRKLAKCDPSPEATRNSGLLPLPDGNRMRYYFLHQSDMLDQYESEAFQKTIHLLAEASQACRMREIRFVVLYVPTRFRVYSDLLEFDPDSECKRWQLNDLPERFERALRKISPQIAFLNLTPLFKRNARDGKLVYFQDDTHLSAYGHKLMSDATRRLLAATEAGPKQDNAPGQ